jgi:hypothetical protein
MVAGQVDQQGIEHRLTREFLHEGETGQIHCTIIEIH